ncbi:hypothetical protein [Aquabacterium sp.]|uniref:hypothetical protein n=1 Tax=Aquabacterium sp. TaxID=1872578 RepID=UPI002C516CE9|nr:hypothetical protein [Aquabacterium sp.]HSW06843.1 hypothetical protein [Aquabacterium sp.]
MSAEDFFAPPAFNPDEALQQLKRSLRDLRTLSERGNGYDLKGQPVIALAAEDKTITARLAKRPARNSPEWDSFTLSASPDVRRFTDEVKRRVARWTEEER